MEYYIRIETLEDIEKFKYSNHELKSRITTRFGGTKRDFRVEIYDDVINLLHGHNRADKDGNSYYETNDFASHNNGKKCIRYKSTIKKNYSTLTSL